MRGLAVPSTFTRDPDPTGEVYRRQARRLRARFGHDRARLYRSLRSLGDGTESRVGRRAGAAETFAGVGPAARFAGIVAGSLDCTILRYSQRTALLRRAQGFGIA